MNDVLSQILQSRTLTAPDGSQLPLHSELPPLEGGVMQLWLEEFRPGKLLEIGLAYGISSLYILDTVSGWDLEHYDIIDAFQSGEWLGIGRKNLLDAGYEGYFDLHEELSEICLPRFLQQKRQYDFAYIDGWHSFDHVMVEFFYINRMLGTGGVVVFDDVHLPSLQKLLRYIANYPCYEPLVLPEEVRNSLQARVRQAAGVPSCRLAGFRKTAGDDRSWDWFEDF